jgi:phage replication O-like protein O
MTRASPQCENGFTRIANELLEAILLRRIPGQELRIVLTVMRKTYGFGKKADRMSYGQIAKATGIPRTRVIRHIKSLVLKRVLGSLNRGTRQPSTIWINKDYSQWIDSPIKETSPKEGTRVVPKKGLEPSLVIGVPQKKEEKETIQKKRSYNKKFDEQFEIFWDVFADKQSKRPTYEKSWCKIPNLTEELIEKIIEGAKRYAIERQNILARGGTPKMAQGWLTDRRWEDEIENSQFPQIPKATTVYQANMLQKELANQAYLERRRQKENEDGIDEREIIDIADSPRAIN